MARRFFGSKKSYSLKSIPAHFTNERQSGRALDVMLLAVLPNFFAQFGALLLCALERLQHLIIELLLSLLPMGDKLLQRVE
jgi:hypothetical protein